MAQKKTKKRAAAPKVRTLGGWRKMPSGSKKRESVPAHVFADQRRRRYPMKLWNSRTGRYEYSDRMLRAVISRANSQGDKAISAKASRLRKKHFGK